MSGTDATRCKVCGGEFGERRVLIDGMAYHPRCSIMSHPPHTWNDYARLSDQFQATIKALMDIRQVCAGPAQHDIAVAECFDIATRAVRAAAPQQPQEIASE